MKASSACRPSWARKAGGAGGMRGPGRPDPCPDVDPEGDPCPCQVVGGAAACPGMTGQFAEDRSQSCLALAEAYPVVEAAYPYPYRDRPVQDR